MSVKVDVPKGYPENPLTAEELKQKFIGLARIALPMRQVENIIKKVESLDSIRVSSLSIVLSRS